MNGNGSVDVASEQIRLVSDADQTVSGGVDLDDVERRFELIGRSPRLIGRSPRDAPGVGINVGLAALGPGVTLEHVMARAAATMLAARRARRAAMTSPRVLERDAGDEPETMSSKRHQDPPHACTHGQPP